MIKVTIITVTYNSDATLADTIESVLSQSYPNIEYLIIDGASSDSTLDIIRQYETAFGGRLKYVSEKDGGIYDAMNKGIRMATGEVVGILNSDDYFTSDGIVTRLASEFEDGDVEAVYGDVHYIRDGSPDKCVRYYSSKKFMRLWLRFGFMPAHPSFYVRRNVYNLAGGYRNDYQIGADYEMMVRLFYKFHIHARYIPMDFVTMRTGGVSTKNLKSKITLIREDVRACRENGIYTNTLMVCTKLFYKLLGLRLL